MYYKKWFFIYSSISVISTIIILIKFNSTSNHRAKEILEKQHTAINISLVNEYFDRRKNLELTVMGKILFLNEPPPSKREKDFKILIWKDGPFLERRHIRYFTDQRDIPFSKCPVTNCALSYKAEDLNSSDAVVFLLHRLKNFDELPDPHKPRPTGQRWIFLTDESPWHTFLYSSDNYWEKYTDIFNWSMSYKVESDIPVPYGRTIPKVQETNNAIEIDLQLLDVPHYIPHFKQKRRDVLVAIMYSNCGSKNTRMLYLKELEKHMTVHVYGGCGTDLKNACPGHFGKDCPKLDEYLFYLSFENSNCEQYITEKLYWNAYRKGAIPVIMGPTRDDCKMMLPPNSYLHTKDYARPVDLARHLLLLNQTWDEGFFGFHQWRHNFAISNEHGYFGNPSVHYCRICEALNYNNDTAKVYRIGDLSSFLNQRKNCILETTLETFSSGSNESD